MSPSGIGDEGAVLTGYRIEHMLELAAADVNPGGDRTGFDQLTAAD